MITIVKEMETESSVPHTKIKATDVYEVLESRKFIENIYNEMLHDIKNSSAYINLKEIALQHFASFEVDENDSKDVNESIERRKKQTYDVGYLSDCIASTLTKTVQEKLLALQDDICAASHAVIEELEAKNSNGGELTNPTTLPKQNGSHICSSSTSSMRNRKRRVESNSDTDVSPSKRLSNRLKKPNSKYYSDYYFDDTSKES